jgi:hypothetical protein
MQESMKLDRFFKKQERFIKTRARCQSSKSIKIEPIVISLHILNILMTINLGNK